MNSHVTSQQRKLYTQMVSADVFKGVRFKCFEQVVAEVNTSGNTDTIERSTFNC